MLGIMIYNELKMNQHVSIRKKSLINQLNLRLVTLKKLVRVLDFKFSLPLANAIFHSKLLYGIEAWGLCPKYLIKKIQTIQNKAARYVQGYKSRTLDTNTLLKNMKWLPIQELINYRISCLVHQIINTKTPIYLYEMLITNNQTNTRNKVGNKLGTKPREIGKTMYTKNQFCSRAYDIYNNIPSIITSITKRDMFKNI